MKKFNPKARKRELDNLFSQYVRLRDGQCQWCGRKETLQNHHIITKTKGNIARFDTQNMICLCYNCHINRLPHETVEYSRFIEAWLNDRDMTYDQLKETFNGMAYQNFTQDFFEGKKKIILEMTASLQ